MPNNRSLIIVAVAVTALLAVIAVLLTIGSSDVSPGGEPPEYKVFENENAGSKERPVINIKAETKTDKLNDLQFAAQELIIAENKKNSGLESVIVEFYRDKDDLAVLPVGEMLWQRNESGGLSLGSRDPFSSGSWEWKISEASKIETPVISVDDVEVSGDDSVSVSGRIVESIGSLGYEVYDPDTEQIEEAVDLKIGKDAEKFSFEWQPDKGLTKMTGLYVIRVVSTKPDDSASIELWVKIDLEKRTWVQPVEAIEPRPEDPETPGDGQHP